MNDLPAALSREELAALVRRVFAPRPDDTGIAVLVDLADGEVSDEPAWRERRRIARGWVDELRHSDLGLDVRLCAYRNVRMNNADLPPSAWLLEEGLTDDADVLDPAAAVGFDEVFRRHSILLAPTRFSATAPLKLAAPQYGFRAATMAGFGPAMVSALRLDYEEIHRRVVRLKALLDEASGADFLFAVGDRESELHLDLRFRQAHASGGLVRQPGMAGNLPSGET